MNSQIISQIKEALGNGSTKILLLIFPAMLYFGLLVVLNRRNSARLAQLGESPGWLRFGGGMLLNSMRINIGLAGVGLLCALLIFQSGLFTRKTGQVSQRSYDAVMSKWGAPHEQSELSVRQYVWELHTEEEFAGGGKRDVTEPSAEMGEAEEQVLSDETFEFELDAQGKPRNPRALARRVHKRVRKELPAQDSILAAQALIKIKSTPRWLGGAGFAGYEDDCSFTYTISNRSAVPTRAEFEFSLPGKGHGIFNHLAVAENGKDLNNEVHLAGHALQWKRDLKPGEQSKVQVHYDSRGLEYYRYSPGSFREQYTVQIHLLGVPRERLNFPIGAMSPSDDLSTLSGEDYVLHWDLSHAVTNFSMGVIIPAPRAPGCDVARILKAAPPGLVMLIVVLIVTRMLLGAALEMLPLALSALTHYLAYVAFANFSSLLDTFAWAYLAGVTLPALGGAYLWIGRYGWKFDGIQSGVLHLLFTFGYPLAIYFEDYTGTILYTFYILIALYLIALAVATKQPEAASRSVSASGQASIPLICGVESV